MFYFRGYSQLCTTSSASDASYFSAQYTILSKDAERSARVSEPLECVLDHKELHNFATQIARGMKHLHKQQITHRYEDNISIETKLKNWFFILLRSDLAARNILIDENKTLKISDFGLSRNGIYVNTRNKKVNQKEYHCRDNSPLKVTRYRCSASNSWDGLGVFFI